MVRCAVIGELDIHTARKRCAIDLNRADASRNLLWILDNDFVARGVITEEHREVKTLLEEIEELGSKAMILEESFRN